MTLEHLCSASHTNTAFLTPHNMNLHSSTSAAFVPVALGFRATFRPVMTSASPANPPPPRPKPSKRLCVLSDGTWNTPDNTEKSNIVKLAEGISHICSDNVPQVVLYDQGVGTSGPVDKWLGGILGEGIDTNIKQLYTFLAHNYNDGDEVYMFGYSRGAYTVRSLAGLIHDCGLVRRGALDQVDDAYDLYRRNLGDESKELREFREMNGGRVPLELVCCFDTVGSLGVPQTMGLLNMVTRKRYEFHDTRLSEIIRNAIHLVALDEERVSFKPTLMFQNETVPSQLTQKYFWGTHGGIGGGELTELDNGRIALRFTLDEMKHRGLGLAIDDTIAPDYPESTAQEKTLTAGKGGVFGVLTAIRGRFIRTVEEVEEVHHTAVERFQKNGVWRPKALMMIEKALLGADVDNLK